MLFPSNPVKGGSNHGHNSHAQRFGEIRSCSLSKAIRAPESRPCVRREVCYLWLVWLLATLAHKILFAGSRSFSPISSHHLLHQGSSVPPLLVFLLLLEWSLLSALVRSVYEYHQSGVPNSLDNDTRDSQSFSTFKLHLNTHLFQSAFDITSSNLASPSTALWFLSRDAVYSAKRGLAIACRLSVCLSVHPSVTLMDQ